MKMVAVVKNVQPSELSNKLRPQKSRVLITSTHIGDINNIGGAHPCFGRSLSRATDANVGDKFLRVREKNGVVVTVDRGVQGLPPGKGKLERHAEDHVEGEWIGGAPVRRPVGAKDEIGFHDTGLEEAVLNREALDYQRRDSKRRRPDIETSAASGGEAVPKPPQETGIHGQRNISGFV